MFKKTVQDFESQRFGIQQEIEFVTLLVLLVPEWKGPRLICNPGENPSFRNSSILSSN
jgi:hypothetical protein